LRIPNIEIIPNDALPNREKNRIHNPRNNHIVVAILGGKIDIRLGWLG